MKKQMMQMILIKTHKSNLSKVVEHCKHALNVQPNLKQGDLILIAQTKRDLLPGEKPIKYIMEFSRIYRDIYNESFKIWGKKWKYIIEGINCRALKNPFDISLIQISDHNYKSGGPFTYVRKEDVDFLFKKGYLETL